MSEQNDFGIRPGVVSFAKSSSFHTRVRFAFEYILSRLVSTTCDPRLVRIVKISSCHLCTDGIVPLFPFPCPSEHIHSHRSGESRSFCGHSLAAHVTVNESTCRYTCALRAHTTRFALPNQTFIRWIVKIVTHSFSTYWILLIHRVPLPHRVEHLCAKSERVSIVFAFFRLSSHVLHRIAYLYLSFDYYVYGIFACTKPSQSNHCETRADVGEWVRECAVHFPCGEFYCCRNDFVSINNYCHDFIIISSCARACRALSQLTAHDYWIDTNTFTTLSTRDTAVAASTLWRYCANDNGSEEGNIATFIENVLLYIQCNGSSFSRFVLAARQPAIGRRKKANEQIPRMTFGLFANVAGIELNAVCVFK